MHERAIFLEALERNSNERAEFLEQSCGGDAPLRQRVESLLSSHAAVGAFLETPALEQSTVPEASVALDQTLVSGETGKLDDSLSFLSPPQRPGSLGRLGHYEVQNLIGRGGMGMVLRAYDEKLHRVVALKVVSRELASSPTARKRFIREAISAARISHDNVVHIHSVEDEGPVPYLVLQHVEGKSLDDRLREEGSLEVHEILRIGVQIASGLAAAHKQGLIHRDIKPANILLENGVQRVKITDFGLARAADDASVTQTGTIAGTPQYMSPEQAQDHPIDHRSDLFSLGSVLYALCAGRPPFRASTTVAVLRRVCDEAPRPLQEINPDTPDWLCEIINKLLAKKPAERFQSAREVADELEKHLAELQCPARQAERLAAGGSQPRVGERSIRLSDEHSPAGNAATTVVASPVRKSRWPLIAGGALLATVLAGIIIINTGRGQFVIETDDPDIAFRVTPSGVKLEDRKTRREYDLKVARHDPKTGEYELEVTDVPAGLSFPTKSFVIKRGDKVAVKAWFQPSLAVANGPEASGQWLQLFNKKDLAGWVLQAAKTEPMPERSWEVLEGVLIARGLPNTYLRTERPFESFMLELECQASQPFSVAKPGWAGDLLFQIPVPDPGFAQTTGLRLQVQPGGKGHFGSMGAAAFSPREVDWSGFKNTWNQLRVEVVPGKFQVALNGQTVLSVPEARPKLGYFGIMSVATGMRYRNLRIKEVSPEPQQARNPFGLADVPDPDGADVQAFAASMNLSGAASDANAAAWSADVVYASAGSIDGKWSGRWNGGVGGKNWTTGETVVKSVGDRVYLLHKDESFSFLIDARRVAPNRLVGRHMNLKTPGDAFPWVGQIVSPERIDGHWTQGRFDFRRRVEIVKNPFHVADVKDPDGADVQAFAAMVKLEGDTSDVNAHLWTYETASPEPGSINGRWASRWDNGARDWVTRTAEVKSIGDRVYMIWGDNDYLIDARRVGPDRLVGRYQNLIAPDDTTPWVGKIVSPERIDGFWNNGSEPATARWDFRRTVRYSTAGVANSGPLTGLRNSSRTLYFELTGSDVGFVYGTDVYTDDSMLTVAAVHAGVLKLGERGVVQVTLLPGQDAYQGSTRNGVTSSAWGEYPGSFRLEKAPPGIAGIPVIRAPAANSISSQQAAAEMQKHLGQIGATFVLRIVGSADGIVWGSDIYTDDSDLPTAAVHAGVLKAGEAGQVKVTILAGREAYEGTSRNGVSTSPYGAWEGSFRVEPAGADVGKPAAPAEGQTTRAAQVRSGTWSVDQQNLVQSDAVGENRQVFFGDPHWTEYDFSFTAVKTAGAFGVSALFRARDDKNYLVFDLAGVQNRKYTIERFRDGKHNWVKFDRDGKMQTDRVYQVRVEARGEHFRCFVDDALIYELTDGNYERGGVGFRCWGAAVRLNAIRVTAPDGRVLWEGAPEIPAASPHD